MNEPLADRIQPGSLFVAGGAIGLGVAAGKWVYAAGLGSAGLFVLLCIIVPLTAGIAIKRAAVVHALLLNLSMAGALLASANAFYHARGMESVGPRSTAIAMAFAASFSMLALVGRLIRTDFQQRRQHADASGPDRRGRQ